MDRKVDERRNEAGSTESDIYHDNLIQNDQVGVLTRRQDKNMMPPNNVDLYEEVEGEGGRRPGRAAGRTPV